MKLKKPMTIKAPASASASGGGATIADRFKLENVAEPTGRTVNKTAALIALIAAVVGLILSGALTFTLYQHMAFLMPA